MFLTAFGEDFQLLLMRALNAFGSRPLTSLHRAQKHTSCLKLSGGFNYLRLTVSVVQWNLSLHLVLFQVFPMISVLKEETTTGYPLQFHNSKVK